MNSTLIIAAVALVLVWNIIVFAMYGIDKKKAKSGQWRTPESVLIICAFLMGAPGALLGMSVFRHKTQHLKFILLVPLALIVNIAAVCGIIYILK